MSCIEAVTSDIEDVTAHIDAATAHIDHATSHTATVTARMAPGSIKPPFEPTATAPEKWRSHFILKLKIELK